MTTLPMDIELEGWEDNANKVTLADLQQKVQEGK
jgi:hypothetical protein